MLLAELTFPAAPDHVRTARMLAARVARDEGAGDDLVEDVRLAVGEACALSVGDAEQLEITLNSGVDALSVTVRRLGVGASGAPLLSEDAKQLSRVLLQALAPQLTESDDRLVLTWPTLG